MKKNIAVLFAACVALAGCVSSFAQEAPYADEAKKVEANLFTDLGQAINVESTLDKALDAQLTTVIDGDACEEDAIKCCWIGYNCYYPTYYHYHYYGWYCPVYYCNFRIVYYTAPYTYYVMSDSGEESVVKARRRATGAVVSDDVKPNSPLYKAGIRKGDLITTIDGAPVNGVSDLKKLTRNSRVKYVKGNKVQISEIQVSGGRSNFSKSGDFEFDGGERPTDGVAGAGKSLYEYFDSLK